MKIQQNQTNCQAPIFKGRIVRINPEELTQEGIDIFKNLAVRTKGEIRVEQFESPIVPKNSKESFCVAVTDKFMDLLSGLLSIFQPGHSGVVVNDVEIAGRRLEELYKYTYTNKFPEKK